MLDEKFIAKLIERLNNEDWGKWLEEEKQSMEALKLVPSDVFYDNFLKKIKHEIDKLKE